MINERKYVLNDNVDFADKSPELHSYGHALRGVVEIQKIRW